MGRLLAGLIYSFLFCLGLGLMLVYPVGWLFFRWPGPFTGPLGQSFIWGMLDVMAWMVAGIVLMFVGSALSHVAERLQGER